MPTIQSILNSIDVAALNTFQQLRRTRNINFFVHYFRFCMVFVRFLYGEFVSA